MKKYALFILGLVILLGSAGTVAALPETVRQAHLEDFDAIADVITKYHPTS